MQKDWFPFFSMLFWLVTKCVALSLLLAGLTGLYALLTIAFTFWGLIYALVLVAGGVFLLTNEILYDLATAEMRRRQAVAK